MCLPRARARGGGGSGGHACHGPSLPASLPAARLSWDGAARQAEVGAGGAAAEAKGSLAPIREGSRGFARVQIRELTGETRADRSNDRYCKFVRSNS
jgi:hypothetical protein